MYGDDRFHPEPNMRAVVAMLARGRRLDFARTSILFSAIAAEAYINAFIFDHFLESDRQALDRLRTVDKYMIAPRLLEDGPTFRRGREPLTSLTELFDLRNGLVHPKPELRLRSTETFPVEPRGFDRLNPEVAARMVVAVATASLTLTMWPDGKPTDMTAVLLWQGRHKVRAYGHRARTSMPPLDAKGEPTLVVQIIRARSRARKKRASE